MLWMQLMKRTFFVAFLFSLANLVQNTTGGMLQEQQSWLSFHTLGNIPKLDASYGASELLILCVLLYGMFSALRTVRDASESLKSSIATPADLTVLLEAEGAALDREAVASCMSEYGTVKHVIVVHDVRDVLAR